MHKILVIFVKVIDKVVNIFCFNLLYCIYCIYIYLYLCMCDMMAMWIFLKKTVVSAQVAPSQLLELLKCVIVAGKKYGKSCTQLVFLSSLQWSYTVHLVASQKMHTCIIWTHLQVEMNWKWKWTFSLANCHSDEVKGLCWRIWDFCWLKASIQTSEKKIH